MMAHGRRFSLQPIRVSLAAITSPSSPLSRSRTPLYGNFENLKSWIRGVKPALQNRAQISHWKSCLQRFDGKNFCGSGNKLGMGSIFGVSIGLASLCFSSRSAYALDGADLSANDHRLSLSNAPRDREDPHQLLALIRILLLPVCLVVTVLMNWDHPIILATNILLILMGTKPGPFSVYISIEQLRKRIMDQHPLIYKFKSLYAMKVEVEDYVFLCVARIELNSQELTLVGILGSWWVLPQALSDGIFSGLKDGALRN